MPVNGNIAVQRSVLPNGIAGVDTTVKKIVDLAHSVYGSKSAKIRALSIDTVRNAGVPDKDYYGEMVAIHNWVRDHIRYVRDPVGQETISYPEETAFNSLAGDCDDMTTLEIAMLGSIGIESYPVVVGMFPNNFSHVYLYGKVPDGKGRNAGKTIPLDPIMKNWPAGREAADVKAKKAYPNLSNPLTMNGLPMGQDLGDIGAYAVAPSYLDMEDSHAGSLVIPDGKASHLHFDKTVANGTRVNMPFEGLDRLFGGMGASEGGDTFSATSAGTDGTIVQSGGQMVPKGFIRNGPDLSETMAMTPATAAQLGPRGPIYAQRARQSKDYMNKAQHPKIQTRAGLLKDGLVKGVAVQKIIGQKRYTLPTVAQETRKAQGLTANPTTPIDSKNIVVLNSIPLDRLGTPAAPVPTIGEELAGAEMQLAGAKRTFQRYAQLSGQPAPLAQKEAARGAAIQSRKQIDQLEQRVLNLRQRIRSQPVAARSNVRAAAVRAGEQDVENAFLPVNGMGAALVARQARHMPTSVRTPRIPTQGVSRRIGASMSRVIPRGIATSRVPRPVPVRSQVAGLGDFTSFVKQPIVWGSALAFIGVIALRLYLKKRSAA